MALLAERSARFEAWVALARPLAQPWRVVVGAGIGAVVWLGLLAGLMALAAGIGGAGQRPVLLLYLVSFAGLIVGLGAALRLLHGLGPAALLGADGRLHAGGLLAGVAVVAAIAAVTLLPVALVEPPARQQPVGLWLAWLPAALAAILVQSAAEEVAFRGYLQTQLAARFGSRLVWWVLPALLFGALHWNPGELGANAPLVVLAAALLGLVLGDVTARTGNVSLAIGLHFANNVLAMLVIATPSAVSDLALWLSPVDTADPAAVRAAILGNVAVILAAYAAYLWWMRRRGR